MKNIKNTLPNMITLINLSLGVVAILLSVRDDNFNYVIYASLLVMVAALTDRFDGKVARMLDATSDLGKELDSLSDLISFGVAPIIISWKVCFINLGLTGYLISLIFPMAGAYRLARYNITEFNNIFTGVPITIAGAFLTIINLFNCFAHINGKYSDIHTITTAAAIILLSFLMVSKLSIKKF